MKTFVFFFLISTKLKILPDTVAIIASFVFYGVYNQVVY